MAAPSRQSKMLWLRWEKVELMPRRWKGCTAVVGVPVGREGGSSGPGSSGASPGSTSGDSDSTSASPGQLRFESESLRETESEGRVSYSVTCSASKSEEGLSAPALAMLPRPHHTKGLSVRKKVFTTGASCRLTRPGHDQQKELCPTKAQALASKDPPLTWCAACLWCTVQPWLVGRTNPDKGPLWQGCVFRPKCEGACWVGPARRESTVIPKCKYSRGTNRATRTAPTRARRFRPLPYLMPTTVSR